MSSYPESPSPNYITNTEDELSNSSSNSFTTVRQESNHQTDSPLREPIMAESEVERVSYGTPIQKFSKEMINSLSKYKVTEDLTDSNFPTWSQSVKEVFMSMGLSKYLKIENYSDPLLSDEMNEVTAFNITTFILNRLDDHNNTQARNHLTDPKDPSEIIYDPFKCWTYLHKRHNEITEDKLTVVTKALHECKILKSDTLSSYLDKFENLIREFYYYRGQLPDTQTARMLIMSIPSLSETTVELIYTTVKPLTRKGVADYL